MFGKCSAEGAEGRNEMECMGCRCNGSAIEMESYALGQKRTEQLLFPETRQRRGSFLIRKESLFSPILVAFPFNFPLSAHP